MTAATDASPVGTALPGGSLTIRPWEDGLVRNLMDGPPGDGVALHPVWALVGPLRGLDTDLDGLLALVDFSTAGGPLFAGCELEWFEPLAFDVPYAIAGEILALEPKVGRRTGPFDLLTFDLRLERDGRAATRVTFSWVLPRKDRDV